MRDIFPTKYYSDEGFVEYKIEINDEDLDEIIEEYLMRHADFDFDELEVVNNRPMNIWLGKYPLRVNKRRSRQSLKLH